MKSKHTRNSQITYFNHDDNKNNDKDKKSTKPADQVWGYMTEKGKEKKKQKNVQIDAIK